MKHLFIVGLLSSLFLTACAHSTKSCSDNGVCHKDVKKSDCCKDSCAKKTDEKKS